MRIKSAILILLLLPIIMKSQNATATIGNITSCAGENVMVPFDVIDFYDVCAMTIYIGYDTNAAEFLSIQNINPAIPGSISYFASDGQVSIAYSNTNPFYISGEKLFDLNFTFLGDSTLLPFIPGTEIANSNTEVITLTMYPGSIFNGIQIISQPDSVQSYPDNDVIFRVTSLGNPDYQWQENTGSGWLNLQNNDIYSGVTNDTLTIFDVPLNFNGNTYRCLLTAGNCNEITAVALLEVADAFPVATLGIVGSCPESELTEPLFVGDFIDVIEFTFNISFDTDNLEFQGLENIHPDLLPGNLTTAPLADPPGVVIHWENTSPVTISSDKLFDLKFYYHSGNHELAFESGTIVLNSFFNAVDITLNNGSINEHVVPQIIAQPQNDTVIENNDGIFMVEATGANEYLWQISTDGGNSWISLDEAPPYYNVNTPTLTISPAVYSMNDNRFSCRLDNNYCTVYSASAILIVDTLTFIRDIHSNSTLQVSPVPFRDKIHISFLGPKTFDLVCVYSMSGTLLYSFEIINSNREQGEIELDLSTLPGGLFFLKFSGNYMGNPLFEQKKILKTN